MAQSGNIPGEDPIAVLCVGADKTLNYTRQLILERHGYTAVVACNLLEATNAFKQNPIGCVLIEAEFESILPALQSMAPHIAVIVVGLSASDHHGTLSLTELDGPRSLADVVGETLARKRTPH